MASSSLAPFQSRNFALIWSAALVSNVGSWMQAVALGVLVTGITGRPGWTGLVAAAAFIPAGLLSPVGGALADRFDQRRWLMLTTVGEALLALALAGLSFSDRAGPWALAGVAFAGGCASALGFPSYQAMLPRLVERRHLLAAVSLSSAQFNFGRVLGPALAGLALPVAVSASSHGLLGGSGSGVDHALYEGAGWVFVVNAASFAAVIIALALARLARKPAPADGARRLAIVAGVKEGVAIAKADRGCRSAIYLISVVALIASPFIALVPAVAQVGLHRGPTGTAVLVTGQGVGAVVGALCLAPLAKRYGRRRMVLTALLALPVALALYGLAPSLWLAAIAIVFVGGTYIGVLSGLNTVIQLRAPEHARGRVLSLYMMALGTIYPIGALLQGQIANSLGVRRVTVAAGCAMGVCMIGLLLIAPQLFRVLEDPGDGQVGEVGGVGAGGRVGEVGAGEVGECGVGEVGAGEVGECGVGEVGAGEVGECGVRVGGIASTLGFDHGGGE